MSDQLASSRCVVLRAAALSATLAVFASSCDGSDKEFFPRDAIRPASVALVAGELPQAWSAESLLRREGPDIEGLFPIRDSIYRRDAEAYFLLVPDFASECPWDEYPGGEFTLRTNNLGFLEEGLTALKKRGLRILVAGDSHTMLVEARDSFANVLEARLRASGQPDAEACMMGVGYTGPRCYLARLRKYLYLEPDVFVAALFTGNDFWDDLLFAYDVENSPPPPLDENYWKRVGRTKDRWPSALYQGLNQAHWFKHWPGGAAKALAEVVATFEEMSSVCREHEILFVALVIPTKTDVDLEDQPEVRAAAIASLELTEEESQANLRLTESFVQAMRERDIPCVDPTAAMRSDPRPFYWRRDDHLSLEGHRYLGEQLFEAIQKLLL